MKRENSVTHTHGNTRGRPFDGSRPGPGRPRLTVEQRLARRAERAALAAASAKIETGISEALVWAPALIARMAQRALDGDDEALMAFGDRVIEVARRLAELEVERLRALNPGSTSAVQVNFPSLSEIDRRIAELRGLPAPQSSPAQVQSSPVQAPYRARTS
jgi:hypothetical protein